jgi:hypothetical protein
MPVVPARLAPARGFGPDARAVLGIESDHDGIGMHQRRGCPATTTKGPNAMDPRWRHPYGMRPTLRHLMILVVYVALASWMFRQAPPELLPFLLPVSPPLLALIVLLFERPSPAKYWLVGLLASFFFPALATWCDVMAWQYAPVPSSLLFGLFVINSLALAWLVRIARRWPRRCPDCRLRSLLPLGRRGKGLRWCASCGFTQRATAS